jgi:predicted DNA binding CopG/RHH family protein
VTIYLEKGAIEKFKAYAAKHGLKYQSMVNDVVSRYAQELK